MHATVCLIAKGVCSSISMFSVTTAVPILYDFCGVVYKRNFHKIGDPQDDNLRHVGIGPNQNIRLSTRNEDFVKTASHEQFTSLFYTLKLHTHSKILDYIASSSHYINF